MKFVLIDDQSMALLEEFSKDPEPIVSQSCEVALSMLEYERSGKSFEVLYLQTQHRPLLLSWKGAKLSCVLQYLYTQAPQVQ